MERPPLPPELIEKLRQSGIRLDRNGTFWHEGAPVTHERFHKTLLRWLDRLPDGRPILRLDERRYAYVEVEDSDLLVVSMHWQGEHGILTLNDGSEEELDGSTLSQSSDHAMYCKVRKGRLTARFLSPAYYVLAEKIEGTDDGFALRVGSVAHPIAMHPASS